MNFKGNIFIWWSWQHKEAVLQKKCANAVVQKVVNKYLVLLLETFAQWYLQAGFTCASVCLGAGNCMKKQQPITMQSKQLREQIQNT